MPSKVGSRVPGGKYYAQCSVSNFALMSSHASVRMPVALNKNECLRTLSSIYCISCSCFKKGGGGKGKTSEHGQKNDPQ